MANHHKFGYSTSDLVCQEETRGFGLHDDDHESSRDQSNDRNEMGYADEEGLFLLPCLTEENIAWVLQRENAHLPRDDYLRRLKSGDLDVNLRQDAISWMFKACAYHGFSELGLYTALIYFDRFLSTYQLPLTEGTPWIIHLSVVVCLWLAGKLEENIFLSTEKLQECEWEYVYDGKTIEEMEVIVLECLNWNMGSYTPCNFLYYFLRKMNHGSIPLGVMMSKSFEIITFMIKVNSCTCYLEFKPSEIAAAVALNVSIEMHAVDINQALSTCIHMDMDRVLECLEMIQDLPPMHPPVPPSSPATHVAHMPPPPPPSSPVANSPITTNSPIAADSPSGVLSYMSDETRSDGSWPGSSSSNSSSAPTTPESIRVRPDTRGAFT